MTSSPADPQRRETEQLSALVEGLCGEPLLEATRCGTGGNNRVYIVQTTRARYALKCYGGAEVDDRDRLGHEFGALRFLAEAGVRGAVPLAIAANREARCALYEWIEGAAASAHGVADIHAVLSLLGRLHSVRDATGSRMLPLATEGVLRAKEILTQIDRRVGRLRAVAAGEPELRAFLTEELEPELGRRSARLTAVWPEQLPLEQQTLSPSDFGFHNALRRADGSLVFIDFEYFGWDDPAKLTADFLLHPGMTLSRPERLQFIAGAADLYGDAAFHDRLAVSYPLYGIRWALIILNEYLPAMWERRRAAGKASGDWDVAKRHQLDKARRLIHGLRNYEEGEFA